MKTLAVVSQKGGTGKSLLTAHLAVSFEKAGITTAVIDLDPQGSLADFGNKRAMLHQLLSPALSSVSRA